MNDAEATRRPGGRSARVRDAVHQAVLDVVVELGIDKAGIPEISRRANVRNSSIYRRWGTRENLIVDALLAASERMLRVPDTGSLHGDLSAFASELIDYLNTPLGDGLTRTLASFPESEETRSARETFWASRFQEILPMLTRATERGELPPDTDGRALIELLIAPIHFRHLLTREPTDHELASRLATTAIQAMQTVPGITAENRG
ncbi:transcriptional regulator, TetR family [Nocardia nova SH22a]|uniref:Transcriptional regulator, TetR family n=1 Tax=Nocardia nova SH22a TaxID=1415166 RepID=W5TS56_9NOCA|nr:TetR-like C-terminal domain-containing protein [Nocardia nova]AHH20046.1 transcriptional regulator, TetR family [Nocardia nova SH22a]